MARKSVIKFFHIVSYFGDHPKLVERGENAVEAGHVKKLTYDGDRQLITATIEASMKDKAYEVKINFKSDGHIESAQCECPRGTVKCHHIAAALIYAHHNVSITDTICRWNYKKTSKKQSEVKTVEDLFPTKRFRATATVNSDEVREEVYKNICKEDAIVGFRWTLSQEPSPEVLMHPTMEEILFSSPAPTTQYILEKAKLSPQQRAAIELETKGQSLNWKWAKYRKFRLTASNFGRVIAAIRRKSYPPSLFKRLNGSYDLTNVKSVQWGVQNEKSAISVFEGALNRTVNNSGLWLDATGLLGASPDGLLYEKDGTLTLIEVKCPYKYRNDYLKTELQNVKDYILTVNDEKKYVLNKTHEYYHQIQGQIAITKAKKCYLVIWTTKSTVIYEVLPDPNWNHSTSLISFFLNKWTPWALANHRCMEIIEQECMCDALYHKVLAPVEPVLNRLFEIFLPYKAVKEKTCTSFFEVTITLSVALHFGETKLIIYLLTI